MTETSNFYRISIALYLSSLVLPALSQGEGPGLGAIGIELLLIGWLQIPFGLIFLDHANIWLRICLVVPWLANPVYILCLTGFKGLRPFKFTILLLCCILFSGVYLLDSRAMAGPSAAVVQTVPLIGSYMWFSSFLVLGYARVLKTQP